MADASAAKFPSFTSITAASVGLGEGGTRQGYFWSLRTPGRQDAVWFAWHPSRAAQCMEEICTLVENCRFLGIDQEACLREVLKRLPPATSQNVHELTRRRMAAYFKAHARDARPAQAA